MTESQLGSMSTITGEVLENVGNGTTSPFTHSFDDLDEELMHFLEVLHTSLTTDPSPSNERRKQIRKHDIRRYFATMFNNIVNSMDFDLILSYFETFANADAPLDIHYYPAPHELDIDPPSVHHVHVEGPHIMAYYLMCLGVFFPDMTSQLKNGQVITSEHQYGCKLVLETKLKCTQLFDVSIKLALEQMTMFYEQYRSSSAMYPQYSKSHSRSTDSETNTPTNRRRTERKPPKRHHYDHDDCLQMNIQSFANSSPLCTPPKSMGIKCTYVILLDERNHITSITITATEMLYQY